MTNLENITDKGILDRFRSKVFNGIMSAVALATFNYGAIDEGISAWKRHKDTKSGIEVSKLTFADYSAEGVIKTISDAGLIPDGADEFDLDRFRGYQRTLSAFLGERQAAIGAYVTTFCPSFTDVSSDMELVTKRHNEAKAVLDEVKGYSSGHVRALGNKYKGISGFMVERFGLDAHIDMITTANKILGQRGYKGLIGDTEIDWRTQWTNLMNSLQAYEGKLGSIIGEDQTKKGLDQVKQDLKKEYAVLNRIRGWYRHLFSDSSSGDEPDYDLDEIMRQRFGKDNLYETEKRIFGRTIQIGTDSNGETQVNYLVCTKDDAPEAVAEFDKLESIGNPIDPNTTMEFHLISLYDEKGRIKKNVRKGLYRLLKSVHSNNETCRGYQNFDYRKFDYLRDPVNNKPKELSFVVTDGNDVVAVLQGESLTSANFKSNTKGYSGRELIMDELDVVHDENGYSMGKKYFCFSDLIIAPKWQDKGLAHALEEYVLDMVEAQGYDGVVVEFFPEQDVIDSSNGKFCSVSNKVLSQVAERFGATSKYLSKGAFAKDSGYGDYELMLYKFDLNKKAGMQKAA